MDLEKFAEEIRNTGFVLEYKVASALKKEKWTVISNKYYEDDLEGTVREIDLLAYRVKQVNEIRVCTVLLISCKKSEESSWALLSREIDHKDPNVDWWPLHIWSNNKAVTWFSSRKEFSKKYHTEVKSHSKKNALEMPEVDVFAFQEMHNNKKTAQNDKAIYNSITSLIKSQAYEIGAAAQRNKKDNVYQFNLLTILDGNLVRLKFDGDNITPTKIQTEHYISRYIVKRKETFSRIRFITYPHLTEALKEYDNLHNANCKIVAQHRSDFYKDIFTDHERMLVYLEEFRDSIRWYMSHAIEDANGKEYDHKQLWLSWNKEKKSLEIEIWYDEFFISKLNSNKNLRKRVSDSLKSIYRYEGDFQFAEETIPF